MANHTLAGGHLTAKVREFHERRPSSFYIRGAGDPAILGAIETAASSIFAEPGARVSGVSGCLVAVRLSPTVEPASPTCLVR